MKTCGIIILAAGASTRMGVAKQSLEFGGKSLLRRAVDTALASVCRPVIVVLGARSEAFLPLVVGLPVLIVTNEKWERGMGTSIRRGIEAVRATPVEAAMIFLCDQPMVSSSSLDRMVENHFQSAKPITAAAYAGALGTPAIFSASRFEELLSLGDSQGGKLLMQRDPKGVNAFSLPEATIDLDTAEDLKHLSDGHFLKDRQTD